MGDIRKYVIVDIHDNSEDTEYDTLQEAIAACDASEPVAVVERIFTCTDSELAWTSTGDLVWPPTAAGDRMEIYPPDKEDTHPHWSVIGDLRVGHDANYDYTEPIMAAARAAGLSVETDPETSCSYFYCPDEATARKVVDIINEIVPPLWANPTS
jgi:hypothetical protein